MVEQNSKKWYDVSIKACYDGNLNIILNAHENCPDLDIMDSTGSIFSTVCKEGFIDIAKWIHGKYYNCIHHNTYIDGFTNAFHNNHMNIVNWLNELPVFKNNVESNIPFVYYQQIFGAKYPTGNYADLPKGYNSVRYHLAVRTLRRKDEKLGKYLLEKNDKYYVGLTNMFICTCKKRKMHEEDDNTPIDIMN